MSGPDDNVFASSPVPDREVPVAEHVRWALRALRVAQGLLVVLTVQFLVFVVADGRQRSPGHPVDWLVAAQHEDGGFGVEPHADADAETAGVVLLALLDAGEGRSLAAHDVAAWLSKRLERSEESCADSLEILALGRYCRANRDRWERW